MSHPTDDLPEPPRYRVAGRFPGPPRRDKDGLSAEERRFAEQYLIDLSPQRAAERAGLVPQAGSRLLREKRVQDLIAKERASRIGRTRIYADEVVKRWWMLATADPRDIVSLRRVCCRYCYGIEHAYQFTQEELRRERQSHLRAMLALPEDMRVPFDDQGGDGYDGRKPPAAGCPECFGEGRIDYYLEDSDNYSPAAALLFDGIKIGRDGSIDVKMRDRSEALNKVAQFLGLLVQRHALTNLDPARMTNEQLNEVIEQFEHLIATDAATDDPPAAGADPDRPDSDANGDGGREE